MKTLIIGLGLSGRAAAHFLLKRGAQVWGVDRDRELLAYNEELSRLCQEGLLALHDSAELQMQDFDLVVVSPGVPPTHPLYAAALASGREVIGEMELACRYVANRCLGITGSNGKTTTTLLVAHALNQSGRKARALGNVGVPLSAVVDEEGEEILVVELSSWQLETLQARVFDVGAILNITPNHLDRHKTMESYAEAKFNLKNCLKPGAPLFVGRRCWEEFGPILEGWPVQCFDTQSFKLPIEGRMPHDVENMRAAYALCQTFGVTEREFASALSTFSKPPHRIEFVKKLRGVAYYDDSKGTSIDAVMKAVAALEGPVHLIAGGVHKGMRYAAWREAFVGRVLKVYAIGQAAQQIQKDLGDLVPVALFPSLEAAFGQAASSAKVGENVLLSPGCASYDMFKDYNQRGDAFKRLVEELK